MVTGNNNIMEEDQGASHQASGQSNGASWRANPLFDGQDNTSGEDASSASPALSHKTVADDATNNQLLQQETSSFEAVNTMDPSAASRDTPATYLEGQERCSKPLCQTQVATANAHQATNQAPSKPAVAEHGGFCGCLNINIFKGKSAKRAQQPQRTEQAQTAKLPARASAAPSPAEDMAEKILPRWRLKDPLRARQLAATLAQLQNESAARKSTDASLQRSNEDIESLQSAKADIAAQLQETEVQLAITRAQLQSESASNERLFSKAQQLEGQVWSLTARLQDLKTSLERSQREVTGLRASYHESIIALAATHAEMRAQVRRLKAERTEAIQQAKVELDAAIKQLNGEHAKELKAQAQRLQSAHVEEVQSTEDTHDSKVREIQDRHAIELSQIEIGHAHMLHQQRAASDMREAEHTAQVDRLKAKQADVLQQQRAAAEQAEHERQAEIQRLQEQHEAQIQQIQHERKVQIDQLKEEVAQELQRQSFAWQEKLSEQRSAADEESAALKAEKAVELQQQRAAWEGKLCEVLSVAHEQRAAFKARLEKVQSTAAAEKNSLQTELESEKEDFLAEQVQVVAKLTAALEDESAERESLAAEVAELKASLAASEQRRAEQGESPVLARGLLKALLLLCAEMRQNGRWQECAKTSTDDLCAELRRQSIVGKRLAAMRALISAADDAPCLQLPSPASIPVVTETGNDTLPNEASSNLYKQHIPNPSSQDKDTGISQDDCSDVSLAIKKTVLGAQKEESVKEMSVKEDTITLKAAQQRNAATVKVEAMERAQQGGCTVTGEVQEEEWGAAATWVVQLKDIAGAKLVDQATAGDAHSGQAGVPMAARGRTEQAASQLQVAGLPNKGTEKRETRKERKAKGGKKPMSLFGAAQSAAHELPQPARSHAQAAAPASGPQTAPRLQEKLDMLLAKHAGQARQLGAPQALHTALLAAQALASPGQGFLFGSLDHSTAAQAAIDTIENISAHMETMSQQELARVPAAAVHPADDGTALARAEALEAYAQVLDLRTTLMSHIIALAVTVVNDLISGSTEAIEVAQRSRATIESHVEHLQTMGLGLEHTWHQLQSVAWGHFYDLSAAGEAGPA